MEQTQSSETSPKVDTSTPCRSDAKDQRRRRRLSDKTQLVHSGNVGIGNPTHPGPHRVLLSGREQPSLPTFCSGRCTGEGMGLGDIVGVLGDSVGDDGCDDRVRHVTRRACQMRR